MLSQYTVKKTKINWQRLEGFCPRENNQFFWQIWYQTSLQIPTLLGTPDHLDKLLCHVQCFFFKDQRKKDGSIFEPFTMSSFPKTPASCALASEYLQCYKFWRNKFLHRGKFAFWLWKAFVMSYSFCEPIKNHLFCTSFWSPKQEAMLVYNSIHPWACSQEPFTVHFSATIGQLGHENA